MIRQREGRRRLRRCNSRAVLAAKTTTTTPRTIQPTWLLALVFAPVGGAVVVVLGTVVVTSVVEVVVAVEFVVDEGRVVGGVGRVTCSVAEIPTLPPPQRMPMP